FGDAERITRGVAKHMIAAGVGKGTRVGIAFPSGVDWMLGWLAAARIGAISSLLSSTYRPRELREALRIGDVDLLLAPSTMLGDDYAARLEDAVPGLADHGGGPLYLPDLPFLRSIWMTGACDRAWATPVSLNAATPDECDVDDALLDAI